MHKSFPP